jgi:hypothetical protein
MADIFQLRDLGVGEDLVTDFAIIGLVDAPPFFYFAAEPYVLKSCRTDLSAATTACIVKYA